MKKIQLLVLTLLIIASACSSKKTIVKKPLPPGQAKKTMAPGQIKKTTGSKSAAPYAPGQQKKSSAATPSSASKSKSTGNAKKK